jgi:hypothetical protein
MRGWGDRLSNRYIRENQTMANTNEVARCLFPFALGSALAAVSFIASEPAPAAAIIVTQLVSGLAINYASAWISPLLVTLHPREWSSTNLDLDRVARHALLTILFETLTEQGIDRREAENAVAKAANAWDTHIFLDAVSSQAELIAFLRQPQPLQPDRAEAWRARSRGTNTSRFSGPTGPPSGHDSRERSRYCSATTSEPFEPLPFICSGFCC